MENHDFNSEPLTLQQVAMISPQCSQFAYLPGAYIVAEFSSWPDTENHLPIRFHGLTLILCQQGGAKVNVKLETYTITPGKLLVVSPGTYMHKEETLPGGCRNLVLFVDAAFMSDVNIDLGAVNMRALIDNRSPLATLSDTEQLFFNNIIGMLENHALTGGEGVFSTYIARSLMAATSYRLLQMNFERFRPTVPGDDSPTAPRRKTYVQTFMKLLGRYHNRERSLAFYAEKMCISPKYLSSIIKETTGRSAAAWINNFVILEAKNLLRFSGKNIQQVAYTLNFTNQSAFGKYFRHFTGMSPSEYLKGAKTTNDIMLP